MTGHPGDLRRALLLCLVSFLAYNANLREISSQDTIPTRLLPVAIILDQRLDLDRYFRDRPDDAPLPYWIQRVGGHYRSSYPVLPALLAVPIYLGPVLLLGGDSWALVNLLAKVTGSLFAALSVLFVYLGLRRLDSGVDAVGISLVYAFGTSTWSTASQGLWGHGPAQLALAVALYCVLRGEEDRRYLIGVGIAAGLLVAARPPTGFLGLALVASVAHRARWQSLPCLASFGVITLVFLLHNVLVFGSLQGGYAKLTAWTTPLGDGLAGLLVSPSRGLLVYSPVLVFALLGLTLQGRGPHARVFRWAAVGFAASVVLLSRAQIWWGGHSFGPRYVSDFLPLLALALVPAWKRQATSRPLRLLVLSLATWSVLVQAAGAFYHPSPRDLDWNTSPEDVDVAPHRLWDWRDPQLLRLLTHGPHPPGFTGPE